MNRWTGLLLCVLFGGSAAAVAQDGAKPPPPPRLPGQADPTSAGAILASSSGCRQCHAGFNGDALPRNAQSMKSNEFILHNESLIWNQNDIHSVAYENLSGPIGKQMSELLGYDVTTAAQCLTCHAVDKTPLKPLAKKDGTKDFLTGEGGVNCNACHGIGAAWQTAHTEAPNNIGGPLPWRELSPEAKYNQGMADLRNPAVKAKLCVTCHVGSAAEGKVVTHDMYAAGHPPLPPFELSMFMESEPKHWGYPTDAKLVYFKQFADKTAGKDDTWTKFRFHPAEKESLLARASSVGAIAALQAEAELLAADAAIKPGAVDYARFDCYACHHDLKYPSARQKRGYEGAPGRPVMKAWNGALPEVVSKHAETLDGKLADWGKEFPAKWKSLRTAAIAKPLGDAAAIQTTAAEISKWCDTFLIEQTNTTKPIYTPDQSRRLLAMMGDAATSPKWTADPEAAMTLSWAYTTVRGDLKQELTKNDLAAIDKVLAVRVRYPEYYSDPMTKRPKAIVEYLKSRQKKFANYDPEEFTKVFRGLLGTGAQ